MKLGDAGVAAQWTTDRTVVLTGASVITMDEQLGDLVGDLVLRGDRIVDVGPDARRSAPEDALVIDASGSVAVPGLVDAHVHAWEGALRGVSPDSDFPTYMSLTHGLLGPLMTPEDVAIGERITAARSLAQGVTTIVDNCHNVRSLDHGLAAIEALRGSGIRAVFAGGVGQGQPDGHLHGVLEELQERHGDDPRLAVRLMEAFPTLEGWQFAADRGLGVVAEVGGWIPTLDDLLGSGLLGPQTTLDHCAGLTGAQWSMVADSGAALALAPRSDPHYGLGASAAVIDAGRHGVQTAVSSDNEFEYAQDLFTEMRMLMTVQRGAAFAAAAAGEADAPSPYGARDALRAATIGGALAAGLPGTIGVLRPGAKADITIVGLAGLRPIASHLGAVVSYASAADVDTVVVDGVPRVWGGRLLDVDQETLLAEAERSRDHLLAQIGVSVGQLRFAGELHVEQG